jgi:gliding motility-associated-like protein
LVASLLFFGQPIFSQYILNGSAEKNSCNCYTLTKTVEFQSGSVWNSNKINLTNSFDFWFNVYLGCSDLGADGMVFILQPISTSIGSSGEGMGFNGVTPSIGIALDTYQNFNLNDPAYDHISIQANGVISHANDLAGPIPVSSTTDDVEDCQWHKLRISWDASGRWLRTYFDGVLRLEKQIDLVTTIFNNDPLVYWGFSGATGSRFNLQQFCTALNPVFSTSTPNNNVCEGQSVSFTNASESFAPITGYNWSFGDGSFSTDKVPSPHVYSKPGEYPVTLKIRGQDGCETDSTKLVTVGSIPAADVKVYDTCLTKAPRIEFLSKNLGVSYSWAIDGSPMAGSQQPSVSNLSVGDHSVQVTVTSTLGCGLPATSSSDFAIKPNPIINAVVTDGCINESFSLQGEQLDTETSIAKWSWSVQNQQIGSGQNVHHTVQQQGDYEVKLDAVATNGCYSNTVTKNIRIGKAFISANDTTVIKNRPVQLAVKGNGNFTWTPATGLSNTAVFNPVATLSEDQEYLVAVTTPEGCTASEHIKVKVFEGPAIYVPSAFTPNKDGKNDLLLPVYVGIKELKRFLIFNRWGQQVFQTSSLQKGWDGATMAPGTYIWMIQATDDEGQPVLLKGTVTLIR